MDSVAGPLTRYDVIIGLGLAVLGLVWIYLCLRARNARPPSWVARYRGFGSGTNAAAFLGVALVGIAMGTFAQVPALRPLAGVGGLLMVLGVVLAGLGSWLYFPPFLLPRWYRAAKRAGVDMRDPAAVQRFRDGQPGEGTA